jgi:formylglycine-generating enzyme required for sulfatase activity
MTLGHFTFRGVFFCAFFAGLVCRSVYAQNTSEGVAPAPIPGQPWTNTLGMKFVPAGTEGILFCIWDVRVKDYAPFVKETGRDWSKPYFSQTENDPCVDVTWDDAKAYCQWLTKRDQAEGRLAPNQMYRLPTDAEWSTSVGLNENAQSTPIQKDCGIMGVYPWGSQWPPPSKSGNYDQSLTHDDFQKRYPLVSLHKRF